MTAWEKVRTCKHSIFDETWGEFKCKYYCIKIYAPEVACRNCKEYIRKKEQKKK